MCSHRAVDWRPATALDRGFLARLYTGTRRQELAQLGGDTATLSAILDLQFRAQTAHYQQHWPDARSDIVLVDGEPGGRRLVAHRPDAVHLVDIALLPQHQGQGLGAALVREVMQAAAQAGVPLRLQVHEGNPARRLYERLGLRVTGAAAPYLAMAWSHCATSVSPPAP